MAGTTVTLVGGLLLAFLAQKVWTIFYNFFLHPLAKFPGPPDVATGWYMCWQEVFKGRNRSDLLRELHAKHGDVVRVGPNELHFARPTAYHEIYSPSNKWDKEETVYHSFGEDRSSFGFLTYREAKQRKDVLAPLFSKCAALDLQGLVKKNIDRLCSAFTAENAKGKSSDLHFGLKCFTMDTIMQYCFAKDTHATEVPDFKDPMVVAMDASLEGFVVFRHFELVRKMVFAMPGWLAKLTNPVQGGRVDLMAMMWTQVQEVVRTPDTLQKTSHEIVYHRLLDPEANKVTGVPEPGSLFEEALALFFGAVDSSANTFVLGTYRILQNEEILRKLKEELRAAWPDPKVIPDAEDLEKLPYLTAVIKESLRIAPSVAAPLPRIVPPTGATISGKHIPGGTIVGQSIGFVHNSAEVFPTPTHFDPDRWLQPNSALLEKWLVAFSKGPRACLGQNLAMSELYFAFATLFRRFDVKLDGTREEDLKWRDCFLPHFGGKHLRAFCTPVVS
ncbi:Cytochrome P450 monooxygenase yanH [Fulvia fulva]|uniref:Cytochrome P450 monooxygenase yanH n=1 Tax=Passalora fulva TaxID=5499 RepID=A0A9Q8P655_PASFU|nr:Cytochrome P450 monooxygenase yanH [Fulvia fulva]KAK4630865.1 Cytochrome P450 monooxygenase yanH [Fulvia fulva]KAK4632474.1 Cytochrome P450 monooxygenase yanH [Fulvia fulva]UJO14596.1 Cytochrome P450 monooxygenase yanH [Fulvia fulva]WPV11664.1 Cytochrome P450 monooxygenase yanH [Fulvia fulva]WPV26155.1 Cytochrome P450 monooxygenase yanH [Fulvia fulva]